MSKLLIFLAQEINHLEIVENYLTKFGQLSLFFNKLNLTDLQRYTNAGFVFNFLKYIVIPIFILAILVLVTALIFNRYKSENINNKKKEIDTYLNDFLTELLFSNYNATQIKEKILAFKKNIPFEEKWCRYLVLNKIINFKQNLQGLDQNVILLIYKYFGLQEYSQNLLNDRRWYFKSLGIYHFQVLDYKIKKGHIKPFLTNKNKYLRSNALIAVISLSDEKFGVLDNYTEKISRADELKILDIIYQKKSNLPENIDNWLRHKNNSIVNLALKLVIRYKEKLSLPQLIYLLKNTDYLVRKETLLAIRELDLKDANEILIEHYPKENHKRNKISCLKTLGVIGNSQTLEFASDLLAKENDLEIKFEIVNCINKINRSYFDSYTATDQTENDLVKKIVQHVNNPYLN